MLFGPEDCPVPPIFISGNPSTGKTSLLRDMMETLELPNAYVSCIECGSQKLIFDTILNQLYNHKPSAQNNYSNFAKCSDLPSFIEHLQGLKKMFRSGQNSSMPPINNTRYILFDNAERLRQHDPAFFCALLRLDELSGINICTIYITNILRDHFEHVLCTRPVLRVHFPDYSQEEAQEILLRELDEQDAQHSSVARAEILQLHQQFVRMLLDVFWRHSCRSIGDLRRAAPTTPNPPVPDASYVKFAHSLTINRQNLLSFL